MLLPEDGEIGDGLGVWTRGWFRQGLGVFWDIGKYWQWDYVFI